MRTGLALTLVLALSAAACSRSAEPEAREGAPLAMTTNDVYQVSTQTLEGQPVKLDTYRGKVSLLVNVASACGYTPQYAGLQRLHERYGAQGFTVLGFPSNDFGRQEPGSSEEIREFCSSKYRVTFPMFAKVQTKPGAGQSEVYAALARASGALPTWNFGKYLVGRDGTVVKFFPSNVDPEAPELTSAIEAALASK
jgi:glutathione peroxidase